MINYSQPDFYHFSQDSVELAKFVASLDLKPRNVLDLFAGCGVVGIEYANLKPCLSSVDFVEKQKEFLSHIRKNIELNNIPIETNIIIKDFSFVDFFYYDLIIANPPYYALEDGRASTNLNKKECHFLSTKELGTLLKLFIDFVDQGGEVYFLGRDDLKWQRSFQKEIVKIKELRKSSIFTISKSR